ncbi:hypothetical protein C6502_17010 [Candidatus Poribacteria bacterium]|nr:MAG: hypothetical protein C6502_17010 [Candidatus Poribacteria bacterium]
MNGDDKAKTHNTPKVEISVRNFGPIAEADLDLRPLTVFVGPSNTGKTYLSVLIYALHRIFGEFSGFVLSHTLRLLGTGLDYDPPVDKKVLLEQFNKANWDQPFKFSDLPQGVSKRAQTSLNTPYFFGPDLKTELLRCFDLDSLSGLIQSPNNQNDNITIALRVNEADQNLWSLRIGASKSEITLDDGNINENTIIFPADQLPSTSLINSDDTTTLLSEHRRYAEKSYYLPAARSGIIQSHPVIASSLVARSTRTGLETAELSTLSGVVADFIEKLILYEGHTRLRERAKPNDGLNHVAKALEDNVLAGQIIMNPSPTGYPEFVYRPQGTEQDMRMTRSSSMVSELAPLVLFIRGLVRPGDTLIIEEPEAHLHPAAQTQMAATLARLVRAGVRVLVTTHSDFMLQEIGNLMRVGMLKEKDTLKKETNDWLSPEEVGAWHFQNGQPVKEIQFDHTVGIEPEDYEDVVESLYNRWAGLQNRIEELKDESERECE